MSEKTLEKFDREYLETWTESDPVRRRAKVERIWAADGRLVAGPPVGVNGMAFEGHDQIEGFLAQVNEESIVGNGLRFDYDQRVQAGDALLLRWSMLTPDGRSAGRGVEIIFRGDDGKVQTAYVFMGID
jgi:hypothetical protein